MESALIGDAYICVRSNGLYFWLPMEQLLHIVAARILTDALTEQDDPAAAPAALLDGQRIPVFSLRDLLGFAASDGERHALILQTGGTLTGLLLDEVTGTVSAAQKPFLPLPAAAKSAENGFLRGLIWMEREQTLAYVLDPEQLPRLTNEKAGRIP